MTTNKKSFFAKNSLYFFVSSLALIILTVFFSFKIFSKTTHNVQFVIQYAEDFEINPNEIADIEFLNNNNEFETLVGTNLTIEKNKPVTFRIKLNNGYKNINNISASNIYNNNIITDGEFIDGSYQWTTDNINSDRVITINNIEAMKLNISEPVIYDFENNILDNNLYVKNWTNYVSYNNKFQFQLDLGNFKEKYRVEKVLACTELDGDLSSEISYDNNICTIELYDHDNENNYCGITSNVSNLEVFLAPEYIEDSLELMAADEPVGVTFKWELIDGENPIKTITLVNTNDESDKIKSSGLGKTDTSATLSGAEVGKTYTVIVGCYDWVDTSGADVKFNYKVENANVGNTKAINNLKRRNVQVTFQWDAIDGENPISKFNNVEVQEETYSVELNLPAGKEYKPNITLRDWAQWDSEIPDITVTPSETTNTKKIKSIERKIADVTFTWTLVDNENPVKTITLENSTAGTIKCTDIEEAAKRGDLPNGKCELTYTVKDAKVGLKYTIELEHQDWVNYENASISTEDGSFSYTVEDENNNLKITGLSRHTAEVTFTWVLVDNENPVRTITLENSTAGTIKCTDIEEAAKKGDLPDGYDELTYNVKDAKAGLKYTINLEYQDWVHFDKACLTDENGNALSAEGGSFSYEVNSTANTLTINGLKRKTVEVTFKWNGAEGSSQNPISSIKTQWGDGNIYGEYTGVIWEGNAGTCKVMTVPAGLDTEFTIALGGFFNQKTKKLRINISDHKSEYDVNSGTCKLTCNPAAKEKYLEVNIEGFEHNDVTVRFERHESVGVVTALGNLTPSDGLSFTVPYGCGNTAFIYSATDLYKLSGTELSYIDNETATERQIKGNLGEGRGGDNTLSFVLDEIYFDETMTFKLPEIEYRVCNLKFDGNYISTGVSLVGDASAVNGSTWTGEGKSFNLSAEATFHITSGTSYTTGLMDVKATVYDGDGSNGELFTLPEIKIENVTAQDRMDFLSTDKLKHTFTLSKDALLEAYKRGGNIVVTLNNIKKLYKFGFDVTGIVPEDEAGKHDINAKYNTYTVINGNFEQSKEYDELELICGNSSEFFIPEGEQFSYTVVLPDNHYYKFKNEDGNAKFSKVFNKESCKIDEDDSIYFANLELEKNYVIANFKVNRPDNIKDTDYDNLRSQFRLWELIKNDDDSITKGKKLSFEDEVRIVRDEDTPIILEMSVGAKLVGKNGNGKVELLKYPVIKDNVTTEVIVDVEPIQLSSENSNIGSEEESVGSVSDYPKYFKCNLNSEYNASINGTNVTQTVSGETPFVIDSLVNTCSVQLDCSGNMKIYEGLFSDSSLISENGLKDVVYGHSLVLRFVHDTSEFDQNQTTQFLTTLQDYLTIESKTNPGELLTLVEDYTVELTNTNGVYTGKVTIKSVTKDLILRFKAGESDQQVIDFKAIHGAKYIMVRKTDNGYEPTAVDFATRRVQIPVNTDIYFAVYTDNPAYKIDNLQISLTVGEDNSNRDSALSYFETSTEILEIDGHNCKVCKMNFKSNAGGISSISGSVSKTPLNIKFTAPTTPDDWGYDESLNYIYEGSTVNAGEERKIYYGNKLEFKVQLSAHCNKSDFKVYAIFNGDKDTKTELHAVNGVYAYMNVTTDIEILVENIELNKYVLNFTPSDKIVYAETDVNNPDSYSSNTFSGTKLVLHDGSFEFFVKANEGYDLGNQVVNVYTMKDGAKSVPPDSGYENNTKYQKFIFKNITEDMTISVKNIQDVKYNINLIPVDGVQYFNDSGMSISGNLKVVHGSNFEFGVSVQDAYDESIPGMFISVNNNTSSRSSAQKLSVGRYIIPNIREDINIQVKNITKNKYIVTLENIEGAEYYSQNNKKITGDNEVAHGDSLIFKVDLYPAYADSKIKVMCGTDELKPDENKMYEVKNVRENLLVDIGGIEKTVVAKLIETIETLPKEIITEDDVYEVIEASRTYESLNETQKSAVTNYNILEDLQKAIAPIHHEYNKVIIEGLDWHIKLIADPISTDMEVCARIYDKLSTEYIVSLYDIYLWDTLTDTRYTLPADKTVVLKLPIPDMSYFKDPSGIHEKDGKKLEFLSLTTSPEYYIMETNSLSPVGIIANRTNERGRSSLIDSLDANINKLTDYTMNLFAQKDNSENSDEQNSNFDNSNPEEQQVEVDDSFFDDLENSNAEGNIGKTQIGSALKLVLILLIILIIITGILIFIKNKNNK